MPVPAGAVGATLLDLSCANSSTCTATGYYDIRQGTGHINRPLAERWNGSTWAVLPIANLGDGGMLDAMSCGGARQCMADLSYGIGATDYTVSELWDGSRWSTRPYAVPPHAWYIPEFSSMGCRGSAFCLAVGGYLRTPALSSPLAEHWDGRRWSVTPLPTPAGAVDAVLLSVSCASTSSCLAVGHWDNKPNTPYRPLAERWDGRRWSLLATPSFSAPGELDRVSCASASSCVALQDSTDGNVAGVVAHWDGMRWISLTLPAAFLPYEVSCPTTHLCEFTGAVAVSQFPNPPAAEEWNAGRWSSQTLVAPPAPSGAGLGAVSCIAAGRCMAVGSANFAPLASGAEDWRVFAERLGH